MTPYERLCRRGGPVGLALALGGAAGCAPVCYDDGLFQDPDCNQATGVGTGTGESSDSSTGPIGTGTGTEDDGVMTADGESGSSSGGPVLCPGLDEELSYGTLTFQIVVDRSNAMLTMFDGGSRWDDVIDALVDMPNGAVTQRQSTTRFGLSTYHGLQAGCPLIDAMAPQLDAADEIAMLLGMVPAPAGANPVADAIEAVTDDLVADPWDGEKSLVLLLGDEPTTCDVPNPINQVQLAITREAAVTAVEAAYAAGFRTAVVALGDDVAPSFLQNLANAGVGHQTGDPDATFHVTHDDAELASALAQIFDPGRPCDFTLGVGLTLEQAPGCTVTVNGMAVDYDDPNGWSRPDEQTVELQGTACEAIQQGDATVAMVCSCDDV